MNQAIRWRKLREPENEKVEEERLRAMRHRKAGRKLNRTSSHRRAMLRNMVTQLLDHEQMITTVAKAKVPSSTKSRTAEPLARRASAAKVAISSSDSSSPKPEFIA